MAKQTVHSNSRVMKTIVQVTVLHPADERLPTSLNDLAAYIEEGAGIGQSAVVSAQQITAMSATRASYS